MGADNFRSFIQKWIDSSHELIHTIGTPLVRIRYHPLRQQYRGMGRNDLEY